MKILRLKRDFFTYRMELLIATSTMDQIGTRPELMSFKTKGRLSLITTASGGTPRYPKGSIFVLRETSLMANPGYPGTLTFTGFIVQRDVKLVVARADLDSEIEFLEPTDEILSKIAVQRL